MSPHERRDLVSQLRNAFNEANHLAVTKDNTQGLLYALRFIDGLRNRLESESR